MPDGGIRSVCLRDNLEVKGHRLKRLEQCAAENSGLLTESQIKAMEEQKEEKQAHSEIEPHHSGFLSIKILILMLALQNFITIKRQRSRQNF